MTTTLDPVEQMIQDQNLTAPRITPEHIEQQVKEVAYLVFPGTMMTVCCITLRNGHSVVGHAACASPERFDETIGQTIAHRDAFQQIGHLEGYLLKEALHQNEVNENG